MMELIEDVFIRCGRCGKITGIHKEDFDFVVNMYSAGFIFLAFMWIHHSMDTDYSQDIHRFCVMLDGSMENALKKFAK